MITKSRFFFSLRLKEVTAGLHDIISALRFNLTGSNLKTDIPSRSRMMAGSSTLSSSGSTVFRNSTKPKISRQANTDRNAHFTTRTAKHILTNNTLVQPTTQGTNQIIGQRLTNVKSKSSIDTSGITTGNDGNLITSDTYGNEVGQTTGTQELESSLNLCKDLGIMDSSATSSISTVILNGPVGTSDTLTNHVQASGLPGGNVGSVVKNIAPAPSPRTPYIVPVSPSSPVTSTIHKNGQVSFSRAR